ncbi:hypothetical protein HQN88_12595 [Paenibacillus qinlingensis]|nr:hypothetical protein [Paenibacillus qinlingensis]
MERIRSMDRTRPLTFASQHRDHCPAKVKGSEERQADIIEQNLASYTSRAYLSGMFIWQFCDCRVVEALGWLMTRSGTKNSKGIVDEYRRPKLAYSVVQKYYKNK